MTEGLVPAKKKGHRNILEQLFEKKKGQSKDGRNVTIYYSIPQKKSFSRFSLGAQHV